MKLVIDLQASQALHSNRGIGRYALSLTQGLLRNASVETDIHIVLNGAFTDSVSRIRKNLSPLIAQKKIHVWYPLASEEKGGDLEWRGNASEIVREAAINHLDPDIVLITSLFEGFHDSSTTSLTHLPTKARVATVLYDLIPMVMEKSYLMNEDYRDWYTAKLDQLRKADLHLCISDATRCESIRLLGTDTQCAINISAATDDDFQPLEISREREAQCRGRTGVTGDFILYTGGIDPRKNITGLIRAFSHLPTELQEHYQLVVVCEIDGTEKLRLNALAAKCGLAKGRLQLTGYVSQNDLTTLYNLCTVFVFPSLQEGFGLPVLEAMQCGCPVITSDCSSLPEVVGLSEALFDPNDEMAISVLLKKVLCDTPFRENLIRHGLERASNFSWDRTALTTLAALNELAAKNSTGQRSPNNLRSSGSRLPKLAFISPLPPAQSGIADYSAELLPVLAKYYEIDVVTAQSEISDNWITEHCGILEPEAFAQDAHTYERILYHFGNSTFHQHMFELLESHPGTVVLHDAYLSGILAHMETHGLSPGAWVRALYSSHGYASVAERFSATDTSSVIWKYPCNIDVIRGALGVIVHSEEPVRQTKKFYGPASAKHFSVIPLMRTPRKTNTDLKAEARKTLKISDKQILVCSFGLLGPTKLNHSLLDAWLGSPLADDSNFVLVFVGENHDGPYGAQLIAEIMQRDIGDRVQITGWADKDTYTRYLQAADVGVQLRTRSRGETSAAVLDCMNHGLATIVNRNGSMNDLPDGAVMKIPDDFSNAELAAALESLGRNSDRRVALGKAAIKEIAARHAPERCGKEYAESIEMFYRSNLAAEHDAITAMTRSTKGSPSDVDLIHAAIALDTSLTEPAHARTLFIDISELVHQDAGTGIQRVVKNILQNWLESAQTQYRIEPVYATLDAPGYLYARKFTLGFIGVSNKWLDDEPISFRAGDQFIGLDLQPDVVPAQRDYLHRMRRHGVLVQFVVYDLLPIRLPDCFVPGGADMLKRWLGVVAEFDGTVCISQSVANELRTWLIQQNALNNDFRISWFHLGATLPSEIIGERPSPTPRVLSNPIRFLMVGTLEPRKAHTQVLAVFEQLWQDGIDVILTIVGKQGWMMDNFVEKLRGHTELDRRLFWLESTDDDSLAKIYRESTCLIAASRGEGFGLPLVEAAQFGLPIIARDIPVFREVAGDAAWYFEGDSERHLLGSLRAWMASHQLGEHPKSSEISCLTWEESSSLLLQQVLDARIFTR